MPQESDKQVFRIGRGRDTGVLGKEEAHAQGVLHEAFSVFVFNSRGELLLQKRALNKYHSGGLWSNTCCSHPGPSEEILASARARLEEEMGITCQLSELFAFTYQASFDNGLTEHEYDHVLTGTTDQDPSPDQSEVADWKWIEPGLLREDMAGNPGNYTHWFKLSIERVLDARA